MFSTSYQLSVTLSNAQFSIASPFLRQLPPPTVSPIIPAIGRTFL